MFLLRNMSLAHIPSVTNQPRAQMSTARLEALAENKSGPRAQAEHDNRTPKATSAFSFSQGALIGYPQMSVTSFSDTCTQFCAYRFIPQAVRSALRFAKLLSICYRAREGEFDTHVHQMSQ
jgi:hypothetical protein